MARHNKARPARWAGQKGRSCRNAGASHRAGRRAGTKNKEIVHYCRHSGDIYLKIASMLIAPSEIPISNGCLRRVVKGDLVPFAEMNADPRVMEFFPRPWSFKESQSAFESIERGFSERGFGVYALEFYKEFAGIVGLSLPTFKTYFTPCVEILWRLSPRFWGKGLASEAGAAVLQMAFQTLRMPQIVAFTTTGNLKSIAVMKRLGMTLDPTPYFDHPTVADIRLKRHILYRAIPDTLHGQVTGNPLP